MKGDVPCWMALLCRGGSRVFSGSSAMADAVASHPDTEKVVPAVAIPLAQREVEEKLMADYREAVEAVREDTCPLANTEEWDTSDGPAPLFVCFNEDGDPIIEAHSLAEAIRGMSACWQHTQERAEKAEAALAALRAKLEASK